MKITAIVTKSIKIVARAIYTYLFFSYTSTLFCWQITAVFLSKLDHTSLLYYQILLVGLFWQQHLGVWFIFFFFCLPEVEIVMKVLPYWAKLLLLCLGRVI